MPYYTRPEEVLVALKTLFDVNAPLLGFRYVATQEEKLIPEYPCIQIASEPLLRDIHGTYTFSMSFVFVLWVYHANFEVGHAVRTIEDMQLATKVVNFLHRPDTRMLREGSTVEGDVVSGEDKLIFSFVSLETPGMIRTGAGSTRSEVITTRLLWLGTAQERFEHG